MQVRRSHIVNCPHCGAENPARDNRCLSCSKGLTIYIGPASSLPRRFGLGPLMLLVAVVGFGLGALRVTPALGITILVLLPPAVIRATAVVSQHAADLRPMNFDQKMMAFFSSVGLMMLVLVSALLAFTVIFTLTAAMTLGAGSYAMPISGAFAGSVAIFFIYWLLRRLWPYKE